MHAVCVRMHRCRLRTLPRILTATLGYPTRAPFPRWLDGDCRFGDRCNFAHGDAELRAMPEGGGYDGGRGYQGGGGGGRGGPMRNDYGGGRVRALKGGCWALDQKH
jgi:hypothetical protein